MTYHPKWGMHGPYTVGPPELRAQALLCALSPRQRQLVMGHLPWSAGDKPKWNRHHYRRGHANLLGRIRAAGVEAHLIRQHVPRPESTGATHRLILWLGPREEWPCLCHAETTGVM